MTVDFLLETMEVKGSGIAFFKSWKKRIDNSERGTQQKYSSQMKEKTVSGEGKLSLSQKMKIKRVAKESSLNRKEVIN